MNAWSRLLPPSTNTAFAGPGVAAAFLLLAGVLEVIPGCIHYLLPDGGAGVIAGLDLSQHGETIVGVFRWFGALQIPTGLLLIVIAWRYRSLVPLGLLWIILARGLLSMDAWFDTDALSRHHPPAHFASPVAVVIALTLLVATLRASPQRTR